MPGGNKRGPAGGGPMTGRRAGFCSGSDAPGYESSRGFRGAGLGRGAAQGRGWAKGLGRSHWHAHGRFNYQPHRYSVRELSSSDELIMLRDELKRAEDNIKVMRERVAELENSKKVN